MLPGVVVEPLTVDLKAHLSEKDWGVVERLVVGKWADVGPEVVAMV